MSYFLVLTKLIFDSVVTSVIKSFLISALFCRCVLPYGIIVFVFFLLSRRVRSIRAVTIRCSDEMLTNEFKLYNFTFFVYEDI